MDLTRDCWYLVALNLDLIDLLSLKLVCKKAYNACRFSKIAELISFGMIAPYKPNYQQLSKILTIVKDSAELINIHAEVGSGKSVVGFACALKLVGDTGKIILSLPPSLIIQWDNFLKSKFGISALIYYGSNPEYNNKPAMKSNFDKSKIIITSRVLSNTIIYKLFDIPPKSVELLDEFKSLEPKAKYKHRIALNIVDFKPNNKFKVHSYKLETCDFNESMADVIVQDYGIPCDGTLIDYYKDTDGIVSITLYLKSFITYGLIWDLPIFNHSFEFTFNHRKKIIYSPYPITSNPVLKTAKFSILKKLLAKCRQANSKVILFDNRNNMLYALAHACQLRGSDVYVYSSKDSIKYRSNELENFKKSKVGVLLTSYKMMGQGHNLPQANHCIFYSLPTNSEQETQAIGRCRRFPQKHQVYVHKFKTYIELLSHVNSSDFYNALTYYGNWTNKGYVKCIPQIIPYLNRYNVGHVSSIFVTNTSFKCSQAYIYHNGPVCHLLTKDGQTIPLTKLHKRDIYILDKNTRIVRTKYEIT